MLRLMFSRSWWPTTLLVLAGIALTVRLGFWQLDRLAQRQAFNAHARAMQAAPALVLSGQALDEDLSGMEYRQVEASGRYDFARQVAVRNQVWTQAWGDEMGYALLTPLLLEDGRAVLVQRGWVPAGYDGPEAWRLLDEPESARVTGIIRLPLERPGMGGGVPDPTLAPGQERLDFWNLVDIPRIRQQVPYPLLPVYVQQAPDPAQSGLPYRSLPELDLNDGPHLGYAGQWFTFAALLVFGYPVYLKKQEQVQA